MEMINFENAFQDKTGGNKKILQSDYLATGDLAIVDQGKKMIAGFTNDLSLKANVKIPCIVFGDHTRIFKYVNFPFALGADGVKVLEPSKNVYPLYAYYFFNQIKLGGKEGYNRNYKYLKEIKIPLPDLKTQQKIASILEQADAAREKRRQANALTEQFLQSAFLEMFGDPVRNEKMWEVKEFGDIASIEKNTIQSDEFSHDDLYVGLEHIEKGSGRLIGFQKTKEIDLKSTKFKFTDEYILYGKLRPYLNKVCFPNISGVCSTDILPIKPIAKKSNKYFVGYIMKQPSFVAKATSMSNGANLPRISPKTLETFKTILPPLTEQKKFAQLVEQVEKLRSKQRESETELENLFQSLMQKYFG